MKPRTKSYFRCHCPRCRAWKQLQRITKKLPKRDAEFLVCMFDSLCELSAEIDMRDAAAKN